MAKKINTRKNSLFLISVIITVGIFFGLIATVYGIQGNTNNRPRAAAAATSTGSTPIREAAWRRSMAGPAGALLVRLNDLNGTNWESGSFLLSLQDNNDVYALGMETGPGDSNLRMVARQYNFVSSSSPYSTETPFTWNRTANDANKKDVVFFFKKALDGTGYVARRQRLLFQAYLVPDNFYFNVDDFESDVQQYLNDGSAKLLINKVFVNMPQSNTDSKIVVRGKQKSGTPTNVPTGTFSVDEIFYQGEPAEGGPNFVNLTFYRWWYEFLPPEEAYNKFNEDISQFSRYFSRIPASDKLWYGSEGGAERLNGLELGVFANGRSM